MTFKNIIILNLFIFIIPLMVYLYFCVFRKYKKIISKLGDNNLIEKLLTINLKFKKRKLIIFFIAIIFILFALARPRFGANIIEAKRKGVDVIIALDTSLSMLAEDIKPNRFEKSRQEIGKLINSLEGDRVGIISFAGSAFIACPLTLDKNTARMFLNVVDMDIMPVQGTAIADSINLALRSFSQKELKYKVLILITDGEDHEGEVLKFAEMAKERGVVIFTIGIGKKEGEPIPLKDDKGQSKGYKKDKHGNVIVSRLDEGLLKKIAALTGGQYAHVVSGDWGLSKIYKNISAMEKKELKSKMITVYEEKYQVFLAIGVLLLLLEVFVSEAQRIMARG